MAAPDGLEDLEVTDAIWNERRLQRLLIEVLAYELLCLEQVRCVGRVVVVLGSAHDVPRSPSPRRCASSLSARVRSFFTAFVERPINSPASASETPRRSSSWITVR